VRHFYKYIVFVLGLGLIFVPKSFAFESLAFAEISDIQDILKPLGGLISAANDFLDNLRIKLSSMPIVQRMIGWVPQSKEDVMGLLDRLAGFFSGINRWLDNVVGVNIYGFLAIIKNLIVWLIQFIISIFKGATSLIR